MSAGPGKLRLLIEDDARFASSNARGGSAWEVSLTAAGEAAAAALAAAAAVKAAAVDEAAAAAAVEAAVGVAVSAVERGGEASGGGGGGGGGGAGVCSSSAGAGVVAGECVPRRVRWWERAACDGEGDCGGGGGGGAVAPLRRWRAADVDAFAIAPMMAITDRHFRTLARLLTRRTRLYTEMVVDSSLIFSDDPEGALGYDPVQHPLALQLGGCDPASLAAAGAIVAGRGYDEVNLNCGCPSSLVRERRFGASLMLEPERVRDCCAALMRTAGGAPVTVKTRLGVDDVDSYAALLAFIDAVAPSGVRHFVLHARKAFLEGLNPKQNRTVPPLRWGVVQALARDRPDIAVSLNGGVRSLDAAAALLSLPRDGDGVVEATDAVPPAAAAAAACGVSAAGVRYGQGLLRGVMMGRAAVEDTWMLWCAARVRVCACWSVSPDAAAAAWPPQRR